MIIRSKIVGAILACVLAISVNVRADQKVDTGVGDSGVALPSSPAFADGGVPVDMFNLVRAETAKYFAEETILSGGNAMRHERTGIDLKNQTVIRSNFDLIYSYGVYDVTGGLKVHVPDYDLYQIVQIFDENHVTLAVVYPGETATLGPEDVTYGEHVYLFMRTQPRTQDEAGIAELNKRQDAVVVEAGSKKPYVSEVFYDPDSFNKLRFSVLNDAVMGKGLAELGFMENLSDIVFPHYQIASIGGWAGLPARHAYYTLVSPSDEASKRGECASTKFNPPNLQYDRNGYWSLTVYDEKGWVASDVFYANTHSATPNSDGSYTIHFNCGDDAINNLQVVPNWNGLFRSYLPDSVEDIIEFNKDFTNNHPVVVIE